MAKELLDIANQIYSLRFRVVWRLGCVTNTFARTFARFARFARILLTPAMEHSNSSLAMGIGKLLRRAGVLQYSKVMDDLGHTQKNRTSKIK
jgi:hypothetical protein